MWFGELKRRPDAPTDAHRQVGSLHTIVDLNLYLELLAGRRGGRLDAYPRTSGRGGVAGRSGGGCSTRIAQRPRRSLGGSSSGAIGSASGTHHVRPRTGGLARAMTKIDS